MPETATHLPPKSCLLGWLGEIGDDLPKEAQHRLRAMFFTSKGALIAGALNTIAVAAVVYAYTDNPVFLAIAVADLLLLCVRIALLKRVTAPSDPVFATGILWAALQASTTFLVVLSGDLALSILVLASAFAAIGGIVGRNFAAPRYAMCQLLILDMSFKIAFSLHFPAFLPLIVAQSAMFVTLNLSIIRQHRKTAVDAICAEIRSREKAYTDAVTGLANRWRLEHAFDQMPSPAIGRALLYLDLDGFKQVNDRLGHAAGDQLLRDVGLRLMDMVKPGTTVCRLGGDEFLVLLPSCDPLELQQLCTRIVTGISTPFQIDSNVLARVGVSVGGALDGTGRQALGELMSKADRALYAVKAAGKGSFRICEETQRSDRREDAPRLRKAG